MPIARWNCYCKAALVCMLRIASELLNLHIRAHHCWPRRAHYNIYVVWAILLKIFREHISYPGLNTVKATLLQIESTLSVRAVTPSVQELASKERENIRQCRSAVSKIKKKEGRGDTITTFKARCWNVRIFGIWKSLTNRNEKRRLACIGKLMISQHYFDQK